MIWRSGDRIWDLICDDRRSSMAVRRSPHRHIATPRRRSTDRVTIARSRSPPARIPRDESWTRREARHRDGGEPGAWLCVGAGARARRLPTAHLQPRRAAHHGRGRVDRRRNRRGRARAWPPMSARPARRAPRRRRGLAASAVSTSSCTMPAARRRAISSPSTADSGSSAFEQNMLSFVRIVEAAVPDLQASGGGRILTIASSSIKQPIPNLVLSNAFRAGVWGLAKTLSRELAPDNILVNVIAPGRIQTERIDEIDRTTANRSGSHARGGSRQLGGERAARAASAGPTSSPPSSRSWRRHGELRHRPGDHGRRRRR